MINYLMARLEYRKFQKFCPNPLLKFPEYRKIREHFIKEKELQKTCKHKGYNFKQHGRCCYDCGMFLTDFGD